tara:strand:+ start:1369 stop:2007 length:639 start_codon:yes stop_codon:yes gene_type:complete
LTKREYIKSILVGFNNTGKTYYVRNVLAKKLLKADKTKKIVLISSNCFDKTLKGVKQVHSFKDLKRLKSGFVVFWDKKHFREHGENGFFDELYQLAEDGHLTNGAIIIDDATKYFSKGVISKVMASFLTDYRHFGLDFFFIFHELKRIPTILLDRIHIVLMKKTTETNLDLKFFNTRGFGNAPAFLKAYKILNKISFDSKLRYTTISVKTGI